MIKVLLYLSILFTSGINAGADAFWFEDSQLSQQSVISDQTDRDNTAEPEDTESLISSQFKPTTLITPSFFTGLRVAACHDFCQSSNFIRAPPFFS